MQICLHSCCVIVYLMCSFALLLYNTKFVKRHVAVASEAFMFYIVDSCHVSTVLCHITVL